MIAKGVTLTPFNTMGDEVESFLGPQADYKPVAAVFVSTTGAISATDDEVSAYLDQVEKPIVAASKLPPKVSLRYTLAKRVALSSMRVGKLLAIQTFAESAVQAVRHTSPFPPPPKSIPTGDLRMVLDPTLPLPKLVPLTETTI